ncbi:MAG: lipocalin-like domain-containing protein [Bacteroidetes bacterium]|nr:lipocalin-like domain-containing protein [Bacteroidota bacterium]MCL5026830.1 lipocalin-like domain-containing protein [Chloroflexota bacterium]
MSANQFIGTWRLVSAVYIAVDGRVGNLFGPHPVGYITYNEDGRMSVAIMRPDRPRFARGERFIEGTPEEKMAAADGYLSYCGKYEVGGNKVAHQIEVSLYPNWVGGDQERTFAFDGNTLTLTTPPFTLHGVQNYGRLVWERV